MKLNRVPVRIFVGRWDILDRYTENKTCEKGLVPVSSQMIGIKSRVNTDSIIIKSRKGKGRKKQIEVVNPTVLNLLGLIFFLFFFFYLFFYNN